MAQIQLITDGDDRTGLLLGPGVRDIVAVPQAADELRRRDIRIPVALGQEGIEIPVPRGGILVRRIFIGFFTGDRQMVDDLQVILRAKLHQTAQILVGVIGAEQHVVKQQDVVGSAVADENIAVAVQDLTASRRDSCIIGEGIHVGIGTYRRLAHLQLKQPHAENTQHQGNKQKHRHSAEGKSMLIHKALRLSQCA